MNGCERQAGGDVVLYFYGELGSSERAAVERHVSACAECRQVFEELATIREALAARPKVEAPLDGDWTAFMLKLDDAIRVEQEAGRSELKVVPIPPKARPRLLEARSWKLVASAALLTIISGLAYLTRAPRESVPVEVLVDGSGSTPSVPASGVPPASAAVRSPEAAFTALSEEHFERSKLVVLGLANKNPRRADEADWTYERGLASNLLSDTRLYRLAAEQRGMKTLAGVMEDLELVLLQAAAAQRSDPGTLEEIQRFIEKRDLVTKMDVAATGS